MNTHCLRFIVTFVTAFILPLTVLAGKNKSPFEWEPVGDADWSVVADSAAGYHDAVMLFEKVHMDDKDWQKDDCLRTVYQRIRILNKDGEKWGDVNVPIIDEDQKVKEILARAITRDGTISELTPDRIHEKTVAKTDDKKYKQKTFSLPGMTDDCIVEYMITYELSSSAGEVLIQKEIPLLKGEYHWIVPQLKMTKAQYDYVKALDPVYDYTTPNYLWLNAHAEQNIEKLPSIKETKELLFTTTDVPAFKSEPKGLPEDYLKERLILYYGSDVSPSAYWGSYSSVAVNGQEKFAKEDKLVRKLAARFKNLPSQQEKIDAAYYWVVDSIFNVTYLDLVDNKGKKVDPKDNETADDVMRHRYGTSRDINRLFCDLLRELNVEATIAFIKDRLDDLFLTQAKYWQFNRSAVAVPIGQEQYRFYSPGYACTTHDMVPWFMEGVSALVAGVGRDLCAVPFSEADRSQATCSSVYEISPDLDLTGRVTLKLSGQYARTLRVKLIDEDTAQYAGILREVIAANYPEGEPDSITVEFLGDLHSPLVLTYYLKFPRLTPTGDKLFFTPLTYLTSDENPFTDAERCGPVLFQYASMERSSAEFHLPEGWRVEALPSDTSFANDAGMIGMQTTNFGNSLSVQRMFKLDFPFWQASLYVVVKNLFDARQQMNSQIVVLTNTPAGE